jgi:hypothetical protein
MQGISGNDVIPEKLATKIIQVIDEIRFDKSTDMLAEILSIVVWLRF